VVDTSPLSNNFGFRKNIQTTPGFFIQFQIFSVPQKLLDNGLVSTRSTSSVPLRRAGGGGERIFVAKNKKG
jgi:hypothetical protein